MKRHRRALHLAFFVLVFLTIGTSDPYQALFLGDDWIFDAVNTITVNQFQPKLISEM